jgi:hypothetical protein
METANERSGFDMPGADMSNAQYLKASRTPAGLFHYHPHSWGCMRWFGAHATLSKGFLPIAATLLT